MPGIGGALFYYIPLNAGRPPFLKVDIQSVGISRGWPLESRHQTLSIARILLYPTGKLEALIDLGFHCVPCLRWETVGCETSWQCSLPTKT